MPPEQETYHPFTKNLPAFLISIYPGSRAIYLLCLVLAGGILSSLPLLKVQVSVSGRGMIRPSQEKANIITAMSGPVEEIYVSEGDYIRKSEPMLKIRSHEAERNLHLWQLELRDTEQYLTDLEGMLGDPVKMPARKQFRSAWEEYCRRLEYLTLSYDKAAREWERQRGLYRAGLISEKEFDDLAFLRKRAWQEKMNFISASKLDWQEEHAGYLERRRSLLKQIEQSEEQIRRSVILAPVSGSLEEFSGIFTGSVMQAGEVIGVISPDSELIGEIYITSRDIGYIRTGQEVSLQLDAFPSREWGLATGVITEISADFIWHDQQAVYRVKCQFPERKLTLRNGVEGELIKGMTFLARCKITSRSLLQLLTDKADDWLDPTVNDRQALSVP
jgi:HlyD family secretion protein